MQTPDDFYAILGVEPDATDDEIRAAWRKKAKYLHPDVGGDEEDFKRATRAMAILGDPEKRARYDRTGSAGEDVNSPEHAARQIIAMLLSQVINDHNYANRDLVSVMIRSIEAELENVRTDRMRTCDRRARIESVRGLFEYRGEGKDIIAAMLDGHREEASRAIANCDRKKLDMETAIKMLKQYHAKRYSRTSDNFTFIEGMSST